MEQRAAINDKRVDFGEAIGSLIAIELRQARIKIAIGGLGM